MVLLVPPPPILSPDTINVYYVIDQLLARSPILIFYGPSATPTAALSNSRIQAHIFSPAGFQSYPRLTVAPSSQLYAAVNNLPREEQGDEICRGLAFSLYKYFTEIPQPVRDAWAKLPNTVGRLPAAPTLFSNAHAALLASKMIKVHNNAEIIKDVRQALAAQSISWLDIDLVLPVGTMRKINLNTRDSILPDPSEADLLKARYGTYAPLIELFGESSFLPTSRMKRAPSKATSINSSSVFSKAQKEAVRQEMNELLDTEESFVSKLSDLVYTVAADFRQKAKRKEPSSQSPDAELLKKLFPPSLDDILVVNSAFLDALRQVVESSENDAIADIEKTPGEGTALPSVPTRSDPTGSLALAMILRSWFPKFAECYGDYVNAHSQFSTHIRKFLSATGSSFSKRVQETGEQRLMSMLIEPVQRLPRYQLYIDNIVKQLPARHPALKSLLKARDSITEICAETVSNTSPRQVIEHLSKVVSAWPSSFQVRGRLVTAVDIAELPPPFRVDAGCSRDVKGIMLLFTDFLVFVRKTRTDALSARGLMAQLDGIDATSQTSSLDFRQALSLPTFNLTEMESGKLLQLTPVNDRNMLIGTRQRPGSSRPGSAHGEQSVQVLQLQGSYEGKTGRFMEELAKARIEGRFSEKERECHAWEIRFTPGPDLNYLVAVQEGADRSRVPDRGLPAPVRVSLYDKGSVIDGETPVSGVEISASVQSTKEGLFQLQVSGVAGASSVDGLTPAEFLPVFTKRISNVLQHQSQIRNTSLTTTLLLRNQHILQSLSIATDQSSPAEAKEQHPIVVNSGSISQRPNSPVKLLTTLFGGGGISRENSSLRRPNVPGAQLLSDTPRLTSASVQAPGSASRPVSKDSNISQISLVPSHASGLLDSRLEETFSSYILSLEARKGNMVGKVIRSRAMADELLVNEVYNGLLQDPSNCEVAAQAPVDVLFAAFEKFIKVAWCNGFGPLISSHVQKTLHELLQSGQDVGNTIQTVMFDMDSPSRSAFKTIVKLLSGLLHEAANDGDKGVLTAAFAEVMAPEGGVFEIMTVLDRLVDDNGLLQASPVESIQATPAGSMSSRHGNLNTAPVIGGHSSSLRKKFGFGSLTRKAKSQMEESGESGSVWRTLSKSKQVPVVCQPMAVPPSSALIRSRSTDIDLRSTKRPNSREKPPPTLGPMPFEEKAQLSTIGENPVASPPPRKKRRSSISDLRSLTASAANSPAPLPLTEVFSPRHIHQESNKQDSPKTPSRKPSLIPAPSPMSSRLQAGSLRGTSPYKRENSPSRALPRPLSIAKTNLSPSKVNEVTVSTHKSNSRRTETIGGRIVTPTGIPTPRPATAGGGLSERPLSGNIRRLPRAPTLQENVKPAPTVQKLRMQSPKKLRERLAAEQTAIDEADSSLQAELTKIGDQLADSRPQSSGDTSELSISGAVKPIGTPRIRSALSPSPAMTSSTPTQLDLPTITKHLSNLSQSHSTLLSHLRTRLDGLSNDITTSLMVSESRAQKLDVLYRDSNAENEALYSRFNEELQKMVGKVKMGGLEAEKEVMRRVRVAEEESESLRRENARLKREIVGLRAQLRES